jgi:hypothetical protein
MTLRNFYDALANKRTLILTKSLTQRHPPNLAKELVFLSCDRLLVYCVTDKARYAVSSSAWWSMDIP